MTPKKAMQLAQRAARDVTQHEESKWLLGKCAAEWCEPYTKGRTDADFFKHLGNDSLSVSMVGDYRRVYVAFGKIRDLFPDLTWTHFRMVMRLPEADQRAALDWAQSEGATCKAMVDKFRRQEKSGDGSRESGAIREPQTRRDRLTALAQAFAACRNMRDLPSDCIVREFADMLDEELEAFEPAAG